MTCPNCGAVYTDSCRFCGACGTPLASDKKGTHRVPILILIILSILGICIFFATGGSGQPADRFRDSSLVVENGVLYAEPGAFDFYTELEIPETIGGETVTAVGERCFTEFRALTVVQLPETVGSIGVSAFENCTSLRAMDLPPALTSIGDDAFRDCTSLEAIHIPACVDYIGQDVFVGCDNLSFIFFDGTINEWSALYTQPLSPETEICCSDGNYFQSE